MTSESERAQLLAIALRHDGITQARSRYALLADDEGDFCSAVAAPCASPARKSMLRRANRINLRELSAQHIRIVETRGRQILAFTDLT